MKKTALTLAIIVIMLFSVVTGADLVKKVSAKTLTVPDDYSTIQGAIAASSFLS